MASSGSITTNEKEGRSITLSWTLSSQSVANNTSTIKWTLKGSGSSGGSSWVMAGAFKAVINGKTVYSSDARIQLKRDQIISSGTTTITHNTDGTKSFSLSCEAGVYTYAISVRANGTHTLNTIPRVSGVSATNTEMNAASTITISRASSSFTHTLTYSFGSASGTIVSKTTSTSVSWKPPLSLASQIPNAISGTCTITCNTYSGSTKVGTKSCTLKLTVPASVKPTIGSLSATRIDGDVPSSWNSYIQTKSKAKLTINSPAGSYGSTISSYSITGGGYSSTASSFTTGFLNDSGTITFTAKVTDSRGRTSDEKTVSITVVPYETPSHTGYMDQRATSDGALNDDGTYIKGFVIFSYSSCNGNNGITCSVYYKKSVDTQWINANKSFVSGTSFTFGDGCISTESSYDVKYVIADTFSEITITDTVSTAAVLMDFKAGGKGIAIGKVSEKEKTLELAQDWELVVHGKKLIDLIYPIGSIYMSVNTASPEVLFGGTWTQIKDCFLLSAGKKHLVGETGGEELHTLTISEVPVHDGHLITNNELNYGGNTNMYLDQSKFVKYGTSGRGWNVVAGNEMQPVGVGRGGSKAHNNMPPYVAVYMWKRIS